MSTPVSPISGNTPANLPTGLVQQLVGVAVKAYRDGQLTDASSRLPGNKAEQQALQALLSLQAANPGALQQQAQQNQSATVNSRIAADRA